MPNATDGVKTRWISDTVELPESESFDKGARDGGVTMIRTWKRHPQSPKHVIASVGTAGGRQAFYRM
jgi:hypothetical protein